MADSSCTLGAHEDHDEEGGSGDYLGLKAGLAVAFLAETLFGTFLPVFFLKSIHFHGIVSCFNVFSGAVFFTTGMTHLLPHVIEYEEEAGLGEDFETGLTLVLVGFLLILFIERVLFNIHHVDSDCDCTTQDQPRRNGMYALIDGGKAMAFEYREPLLTQMAVVVHAVLEAIVMGVAGTRRDVVLLFLAITSHKIFSAAALGTRFIRVPGCSPLKMTLLLLPYHLLPPLAVLVAAGIGSSDPTASLVLSALSTGTFLYVGFYEILSEEFGGGHCHNTRESAPRPPKSVDSVKDVQTLPPPIASSDDVGTETPSREAKSWEPTAFVKFAILLLGTAFLLFLSWVIPDSHAHNH